MQSQRDAGQKGILGISVLLTALVIQAACEDPDAAQEANDAAAVTPDASEEASADDARAEDEAASDQDTGTTEDPETTNDAGIVADASGGEPDSATVYGDAGNDSTVVGDGAIDGMDARVDADAQSNPGDALAPDADAMPTYACHTTAGTGTFPADVVLATGIGSPHAIRGDRLLAGQDINGTLFPRVGKWVLWSLATSELVREIATETTGDATIFGVGDSVFLTRSSSTGTDLRSLQDGSVVWNSACAPGGLSPSGSYAWLKCASNQADMVEFTARNSDGSTWMNGVARSNADTAIVTDDALIAVSSNTTDTTLTVYPRAGGTPSTVGPLAGRLLGVSEDRTHIVTLAAGDLVRVYALDGTRRALRSGKGDVAGGRGGVFWLASSSTRELSFFRIDASGTPLGTTPLGRVDILHDGLGITHNNQQWERVVFTGDSIAIQTHTASAEGRINALASSPQHFAYGLGDRIPLADSYNVGNAEDPRVVSATVVDDSPRRLGCGTIQSTAMHGERLLVGTKNAGIYVYDPPYAAPIAHLPYVALDIRVAHLTGRFAVLSRDRVRVFNADFSLARDDVDLSFIDSRWDNMQIALSPDGSLLSYTTYQAMASRVVARVVRVSTGEVVYEAIRTDTGPLIAHPVVVSPSGHRWIDHDYGAGAFIYEDGSLVGTFAGVGVAWIDENRIAAFFTSLYNPGFDSGRRLVSYEGIQLGTFECAPRAMPYTKLGLGFEAWSQQLQWRDADTVYAIGGNPDVCSGCQCELPGGAAQEVAPLTPGSFSRNAGFGMYSGGTLDNRGGAIRKR